MEGMEMSLAGFFSGKPVLITGHTGFKGAWLSRILSGMGAKVSGYSLAPITKPGLYDALGLERTVAGRISDIRDYKQLLETFRQESPEIVFHLAAQPLVRDSYDDPLHTFSTNVMGTANVLECVRLSQGVKAVVVVTTDKVYEVKDGKPHKETDALGGYDPYSSSKVCAEQVTRCYSRAFFNPENQETKTLIASARAGNVIGGGDWSKDRLVPDIVRALFEKNEPVVIRNPEAVRPWQHVLDPLSGYMMLAKRLYGGDRRAVGAWNFAPEKGSFITTERLVEKFTKMMGRGAYVVRRDESGKHETGVLRLDASKAKRELGWKPVLGIDETLQWTLEWYKSFYRGDDVAGITDAQIGRYMELCAHE
jgi:CDP-glucose 4,6-dehydratase